MLRRTRWTRVKFGGEDLLEGVKRVLRLRTLSNSQEGVPGSIKYVWEAPKGHKSNFTAYNALAKRKTPLVLERQNVVKWYSCGPTVYDVSHIGHGVCYVRFDIIRRILGSENKSVVYVMNITDIDDKIIRRSRELKLNTRDLARQFEVSFFEDLGALNVLPPSAVLRATECIPETIAFVQKLIDLKFAYRLSDGLYFDTSKDSGSPRFREGSPWGQSKLDSVGKRNPADFALWKFAKPQEPSWDTSFGAGRPGWHVECSTMASKIFGSSVDIHSGGKDLEFPHHESEEAQSCAYHSCSNWAKFYIHSGFVQYNSEKMSKSLGNVVSIKDYLKQGTSDEFRMMCLRVPYRSGIQFDDVLRSKSKRTLSKIISVLSDCEDYLQGRFPADVNEEQLLQNLFLTQLKVRECFRDDFDFTEATSAVLNLVETLAKELEETDVPSASAFVAVSSLRDYIRKYFTTLGFHLNVKGENDRTGDRVTDIVDKCVKFRHDVRTGALALESEQKGNLLKLCDAFRDDLKLRGIVVKDKGDRSSWSLERS